MKLIKGNILDTELGHIIHGCNAKGKFGAGVALAIRNKWPKAFEDYKAGLEKSANEPRLLGKVFSSSCDGKVIHNAITQINYGSKNIADARYYAVTDAIRTVISKNNIRSFAIPLIGCGLGGLEWLVMKPLLLELEIDYGIEFWVYIL